MDAGTITREKLAMLVLQVLDGQREYFRLRTPALLAESKQREKNLRRVCDDILSPPAKPQPGLFDAEVQP